MGDLFSVQNALLALDKAGFKAVHPKAEDGVTLARNADLDFLREIHSTRTALQCLEKNCICRKEQGLMERDASKKRPDRSVIRYCIGGTKEGFEISRTVKSYTMYCIDIHTCSFITSRDSCGLFHVSLCGGNLSFLPDFCYLVSPATLSHISRPTGYCWSNLKGAPNLIPPRILPFNHV